MNPARHCFIPCPACAQGSATNLYAIDSNRPIAVGLPRNGDTFYQRNPMSDAELLEHYRDFSRGEGDEVGTRRRRSGAFLFGRFECLLAGLIKQGLAPAQIISLCTSPEAASLSNPYS